MIFARKLRDAQSAAVAGVNAASARIAAEIEARAPRDSGALAASIHPVPARVFHGRVVGGVEITGGHKDKNIVLWKEYGTSQKPATPFIRPGMRAARAPARAEIVRRVVEALT